MDVVRRVRHTMTIKWFCILLPAFLLAVSALATSASADDSKRYAIVFDAGSSGTRVYVYQYAKRYSSFITDISPLSLPVTEKAWSKKVSPGVSSLTPDATAIKNYFDPLLAFVRTDVNQLVGGDLEPDETFLFLGATAGMRMLTPLSTRLAIMDGISAYFKLSGFKFEPRQSRILAGEQEAFFGWISVNYLSSNGFVNWQESTSVGALDLGGASTQITFVADDVLSHLYSWHGPQGVDDVNAYANSYLTYGVNVIYTRQNDYIANAAAGGMTAVNNPCYNTGNSFQYTTSDTKRNITMNGSSDGAACAASMRSLLRLAEPCEFSEGCAVDGRYQPPIPSNMVFYAFSSFASNLQGYGLTGNYALSYIATQRDVICGYDWSTLQAKFPGEVSFGNPGCRALAYTYELLVSGYKFPADSMNVRVVDTLNGQNVEWTLGALIYYLSYEEWAMGCSIFDSSSGVAIGLAFGFVTLFLVGALVYLLMCKNSTQKMHADDDGTNTVSLLESEQLETVSFR